MSTLQFKFRRKRETHPLNTAAGAGRGGQRCWPHMHIAHKHSAPSDLAMPLPDGEGIILAGVAELETPAFVGVYISDNTKTGNPRLRGAAYGRSRDNVPIKKPTRPACRCQRSAYVYGQWAIKVGGVGVSETSRGCRISRDLRVQVALKNCRKVPPPTRVWHNDI